MATLLATNPLLKSYANVLKIYSEKFDFDLITHSKTHDHRTLA